MNKVLLKEIVLEQTERLAKLDEGIGRQSLKEIEKHLKLPHTLAIVGLRRVGKSTLLLQIMRRLYQNGWYYFNFEDERLIDFYPSDFNYLYEIFLELFGQKRVFFFDEIQNVKGWENFIRRMQENGFKFFITGSNASLLGGELGTKLTGRYIPLELYPFSFREFLSFKKYDFKPASFLKTTERAKIKKFFNGYLINGGLPEYLRYQNPEILKHVYEDILYRDIAVRYEIKEVKALRELAMYYLSNLSNLISFNKLKEVLKLGSVNTVKSYTDYLENSFLFFTVNLFSYSLKQQFIAPKKIYCIDNGLVSNLAFGFSKDRGKLLENLVFLELKRRGKDIYYYRTKNNLEIDFLLRTGRKAAELIQVVQDFNHPKTREREIKALFQALKELKLKQGLILSEEQEEIIKQEKKIIKIKPIYKWLLES